MVTTTDLRYKTASAVLRMLGGESSDHASEPEDVLATRAYADEVFDPENGVYHSVLVQGGAGFVRASCEVRDDPTSRVGVD